MLTKLLKYECKTTARMLLPVYAGALLAWCVMTGTDRLCRLLGLQYAFWGSLFNGILNFLFGLMVLVTFVMTIFVAIRQFYRLLGEEGYLLFTLPASPAQHIVAKLVCATGWVCVFFLAMQVLTGRTPVSDAAFDNTTVVAVGSLMFDAGLPFTFFQRLSLDIAFWGLTLLGVGCGYLFLYLCMAIGMQWPNRRLFASVTSYLVISFVCQVTVVLSLVGIGYYFYTNNTAFLAMQNWLGELVMGNMLTFSADGLYRFLWLPIGIGFLLLAAANAILWVLTHHLVSKRLNLA